MSRWNTKFFNFNKIFKKFASGGVDETKVNKLIDVKVEPIKTELSTLDNRITAIEDNPPSSQKQWITALDQEWDINTFAVGTNYYYLDFPLNVKVKQNDIVNVKLTLRDGVQNFTCIVLFPTTFNITTKIEIINMLTLTTPPTVLYCYYLRREETRIVMRIATGKVNYSVVKAEVQV